MKAATFTLSDVRDDIAATVENHKAIYRYLYWGCTASGCKWRYEETIKGDVVPAHAKHVADEVVGLLALIGEYGPLVVES